MPSISGDTTHGNRAVLNPADLQYIDTTPLVDGELAYVITLDRYFTLFKLNADVLSAGHIYPTDLSSNGLTSGRWMHYVADQTVISNIVYRPGDLSPEGNVYTTWQEAYNAASLVNGTTTIEIRDDLISPAVVPAGVYDLSNIVLTGNIEASNKIQLRLDDGVQFTNFGEVKSQLVITSFATTVPVHTTNVGQDTIIIWRGAGLRSDASATQPFFVVPAGSNPIIVLLQGGEMGVGGQPMMEVQAGGNAALILDFVATLANGVIYGPGNANVLVSSQSAFLSTPFPIVQPVAGLNVQIFSYASFSSFQGLLNANWVGPPPANVEEAINRMATTVAALNAGPIP